MFLFLSKIVESTCFWIFCSLKIVYIYFSDYILQTTKLWFNLIIIHYIFQCTSIISVKKCHDRYLCSVSTDSSLVRVNKEIRGNFIQKSSHPIFLSMYIFYFFQKLNWFLGNKYHHYFTYYEVPHCWEELYFTIPSLCVLKFHLRFLCATSNRHDIFVQRDSWPLTTSVHHIRAQSPTGSA